jgi:hypothetical protein
MKTSRFLNIAEIYNQHGNSVLTSLVGTDPYMADGHSSSASMALFTGGWEKDGNTNPFGNGIERKSYYTNADTQTHGTLTKAMGRGTATSSGDYGFTCGGGNIYDFPVEINKYSFATNGSAVSWGEIRDSGSPRGTTAMGAASSKDYGLHLGGRTYTTNTASYASSTTRRYSHNTASSGELWGELLEPIHEAGTAASDGEIAITSYGRKELSGTATSNTIYQVVKFTDATYIVSWGAITGTLSRGGAGGSNGINGISAGGQGFDTFFSQVNSVNLISIKVFGNHNNGWGALSRSVSYGAHAANETSLLMARGRQTSGGTIYHKEVENKSIIENTNSVSWGAHAVMDEVQQCSSGFGNVSSSYFQNVADGHSTSATAALYASGFQYAIGISSHINNTYILSFTDLAERGTHNELGATYYDAEGGSNGSSMIIARGGTSKRISFELGVSTIDWSTTTANWSQAVTSDGRDLMLVGGSTASHSDTSSSNTPIGTIEKISFAVNSASTSLGTLDTPTRNAGISSNGFSVMLIAGQTVHNGFSNWTSAERLANYSYMRNCRMISFYSGKEVSHGELYGDIDTLAGSACSNFADAYIFGGYLIDRSTLQGAYIDDIQRKSFFSKSVSIKEGSLSSPKSFTMASSDGEKAIIDEGINGGENQSIYSFYNGGVALTWGTIDANRYWGASASGNSA